MTNNITKTSVYFTKTQSKITLVFNLIIGANNDDCNSICHPMYLSAHTANLIYHIILFF